MPFYVARQPIFDRERQIHAYELLFRGEAQADGAHFLDGSSATAQLITQGALLGDVRILSGGHPMFVNFTRDLLIAGTAALFQPKWYVIEVLEDVPPEPDVLATCRSLIEGGYRLALDDITDTARLKAFEGAVQMAKVDLLETEHGHVEAIVTEGKRQGLELVAEKVETAEDLAFAMALGFDYFQGYYLSQPESVKRAALPGLEPAHLKLLEVVNRRDLDVTAVARAVEADPSLTYKLLRRVNSAAHGLDRRITSMRDVVVMFGHEEIRRAATFVVMGAIVGGSDQLLHESVTLARFCDGIGARLGTPAERRFDFYVVGLLSNIDALLGQPMDVALEKLPLPEQVVAALARGEGPTADALGLARAFMHADWTAVEVHRADLGLGEAEVARLYVEAVGGADEVMATAA
jgi:EAL and modified HD-GYP domain-containing signal transduction protein